jgi:hypothetical protein
MNLMFREEDFEDIRPYHDDEINPALRRIISNPVFDTILDFFFPYDEKDKIRKLLSETRSVYSFQKNFVDRLVRAIVSKSSSGLTCSGFENLTPGKAYLFISNHRDFVLDSAILQILLFEHGHNTSEITFGSNLMVNQFVIDLGKSNRMFRVVRGGSSRELLHNSQQLSAYIRYTIVSKGISVWIAQRPGRTKNGNDRTETSLLKMLNMSGRGKPEDSLHELNIVPCTVSYEYEPCCALKIKELIATSLTGTYQKQPGEDLNSIIKGIMQQKGRIHFAIGSPLDKSLGQLRNESTFNRKINTLAAIIDKEMYRNFRLWPNNYISWDIQNHSGRFREFYTPDDKAKFLEHMENETGGLTGDRNMINDLFLQIYANPVSNYLTLNR